MQLEIRVLTGDTKFRGQFGVYYGGDPMPLKVCQGLTEAKAYVADVAQTPCKTKIVEVERAGNIIRIGQPEPQSGS